MKKLKSFLNKGIKVRGIDAVGNIHIYGRGGTKSPETFILEYKGKLYSPIQQKHRQVQPSMPTMMMLLYWNAPIRGLLYESNPLLGMIPK